MENNPDQPISPEATVVPPVQPPPAPSSDSNSIPAIPTPPRPNVPNKSLFIALVAVVLVLLLGLGTFAMMKMTKKPVSAPTPMPTPTIIPPTPTSEPTPTSTPAATVVPITPTPKALPMSFNGSAQIKAGDIAPGGTKVEAFIGDVVCASTTTLTKTELTTNFYMEVEPVESRAGCGKNGDTVTFKIDGEKALQTIPFVSGPHSNVILNVHY